MKKVMVIGVLALGLTLFAQEITHETMVVNIEVPVRVLKGGNFIDSLAIDDFEVFEDGVPQRIEAVYLIKKKSIERREEKTRFLPETSRNFYLFFEITEYTGKVGDALGYFINNVMVPGDNLTVVTPMKTYRMKSETFDVLSKEQIQNQFVKILRRDTLEGSAEYRNAVNELTGLAKALSSGSNIQDEFGTAEYDGLELDVQIMMYADLLKRLEQVRMVDQKKLLEFAEYLKDMERTAYIMI